MIAKRAWTTAVRLTLAAVLLLSASACGSRGWWTAAPEFPSAVASGAPAQGSRHMIATAHPLASKAGLDTLRAGRTAIDAAIAAQMVLNLVEPQSSGIGGGGFLLYFDAKTGTIVAYDGRETAPASAKPEMFPNAEGQPREFFDAVVGGLSVGVPGLLRMLEAAHRDFGRTPWKALFDPAIGLAESGFPVSPRLHKEIAQDRYLPSFPEAAHTFYTADGKPLPVGARLTNKAFADTLQRISRDGADAFYKGDIAKDIVRIVRYAARNPAVLTEADLASYRAVKRDPVCLSYRLRRICGMPPPSSGGIATLQIVGLLEPFDMAATAPESVRAVHRIAEASRLAFADRDAYIADPDFVRVPTAGLLDPAYLTERRRLISDQAALGEAEPGQPFGRVESADRRPRRSAGVEAGLSTTHLSVIDEEGNSVIDEEGNAVAMTTSIESTFGSRLMVRGFLLNNELTDFVFAPERDGVAVAKPRRAWETTPQRHGADAGVR